GPFWPAASSTTAPSTARSTASTRWATADELVCELADPAARVEDRFLGHIPPRLDRPAEAAMWAVRCLCHIVEIRSDARTGTRVRLHTRLDDPSAGRPPGPEGRP
ncbi:hypothetical protein AB0J52_30960, partial [Spirillospora sp. NPDC049652]